MSFDLSWIGTTLDSEEFRVNTARLAQFAAATDDTNPTHAAGLIAAPVFANIPAMQVMVAALRRVTTLFAFHGQHDFVFHRPILPGMRLLSSATVSGVQPGAAGVAVIIKLAMRTTDGALVNEQVFTAFAAKASIDRAAGEPAPEHRLPPGAKSAPALACLTYPMSADQTRRYADASRDYSDYALDPDAARAKGFEHVLVHGMLTLAFAGRAVVETVCAGDSTRLKRFAARFSNPVYLVPGQAIATTLWSLDRERERARYGFEATDSSGRIVIAHGRVEVAA